MLLYCPFLSYIVSLLHPSLFPFFHYFIILSFSFSLSLSHFFSSVSFALSLTSLLSLPLSHCLFLSLSLLCYLSLPLLCFQKRMHLNDHQALFKLDVRLSMEGWQLVCGILTRGASLHSYASSSPPLFRPSVHYLFIYFKCPIGRKLVGY